MSTDAPARAQTVKKTAGPAPAVARIGKPLTEQKTKVNLLYYGDPGTAKTTSGLRLSRLGKVLTIDAEGGVKIEALRAQGVDVSNVETWPETPGDLTEDNLDALYDDLVAKFRADPNYLVGIVFDSWTEIARRLLESATAFNSAQDAARNKARASHWQTNIEDYGLQSNMLRTILRKFRNLPCHLILTALERRDTDKDTGFVSYGPQLGPSVANDTMGLVDIVMYTCWQQVGDEVFNIGKTSRIPLRRVKDRFGLLPPHMVLPTADRIVQYIAGDLTLETDTVRAEMRAKAEAALQQDNPTVPADVPPNEEPAADPAADQTDKEKSDAPTA